MAKKAVTNLPGLVYLTERILLVPFPSEGKVKRMLSNFLNTHHTSNYIIYNISEHKYNSDDFNNNVMEYSFPGYPGPPLDQMFQICQSMRAWLDIDL